MRPTGISVVVLLTFLLAPRANADVTTGLIAHWPLDGDAQDISGNGNHGVVVNATPTQDRNGNPNGAYAFNGSNTWIEVPSSVSLGSPTTQVTQVAWINNAGWSLVGQSYNPIIVKSNSDVNAFMYRMIAGAGGVGLAVNSWNTSTSLGSPFTFDTWNLVAMVYDAGSVHCYVDGVLVESDVLTETSMTQDSRDLRIGACVPGILEVFNGKIDDVRIYNRALSAADIAELYDTPVAASPIVGASIVYLEQNYPNPFQTRTTIAYSLTGDTHVSLGVYDVAGRLVRMLGDLPGSTGRHFVSWDSRDSSGAALASGIYYLRLTGPTLEPAARKMMVVD